MASKEGKRRRDGLVPLSALISKESALDKMEKPRIEYGSAMQSKKGEDFFLIKTDCQRIPGSTSTYSVFGVFDGHNGSAAAIYAKEHLLNHVLSSMPRGLTRDEWLQALNRALVAGFVKTDKEFRSKGGSSGTTATVVVIDELTITAACVGDSRCVLDSHGSSVSDLTIDHRLDDNEEERERVVASGGEIGRISVAGGAEIGPVRCWPGGLCLSRSIGDLDVGEFIVAIPHVKQVKLSRSGGRIIIASDGVWDTMSSAAAAEACRGLPAALAARQVVKESVRSRGLRDDTTCIVVDLITGESSPSEKRWGKLKSLMWWRRSAKKTSAVSEMEEIFEEGSAMLSERLGEKESAAEGLFHCAICKLDLSLNQGISVHAGSIFSTAAKPWLGPFLCAHCRHKQCNLYPLS